MNGAPRIAPTPTLWEAAEPPPVRIAMIGIIVYGRAVPTAASTDPTAPSASSSFRPNHSIPFVNSSAPIRMTTKARTRMPMSTRSTSALGEAGDDDTRGDHHEDRARDEGHIALAAAGVADQGARDARRRRRHDDDETEPDEARRLERRKIGGDPARVEARIGGPWATADREKQGAPDREQGARAG